MTDRLRTIIDAMNYQTTPVLLREWRKGLTEGPVDKLAGLTEDERHEFERRYDYRLAELMGQQSLIL